MSAILHDQFAFEIKTQQDFMLAQAIDPDLDKATLSEVKGLFFVLSGKFRGFLFSAKDLKAYSITVYKGETKPVAVVHFRQEP